MANISRETFNKMKHYVSVRLQQGVPLVDADWNEMEDIRRFELQAFLKWFVGDGVPVGNDGFRIKEDITGRIVLTSKKTEIKIDLSQSTAAEKLGFDSSNCRAARWFPPAAQLLGRKAGPFSDLVAKTLVIKTHNPREAEWSTDTVAFQESDFHDSNQATAAEVVAAINRAAQLTATVGASNDFAIQGGDGTPEGAGRCLVEGLDVINDSDLCYTGQRLYGNDALADLWTVERLPRLTVPDQDRTDLVYLDVWEREVNKDEDAELENPKIGVPTCVRFKREWVVRVAENVPENTNTFPDTFLKKEGHVYYPLARITHKGYRDIVDLRRKGLAGLSQELTIKNGKVGIGMTEPWAKLDVLCDTLEPWGSVAGRFIAKAENHNNAAGEFSAESSGYGSALGLNIKATTGPDGVLTTGILASVEGLGNGNTSAGFFNAVGQGNDDKETTGIFAIASGDGTGPKYGIKAEASGNGRVYAGYFDGNVSVNGYVGTNILVVGVPNIGQLNTGDAVITGNVGIGTDALIAGNVGIGVQSTESTEARLTIVDATTGAGNNYGIHSTVSGGGANYGIHSTVSGGGVNVAGFFKATPSAENYRTYGIHAIAPGNGSVDVYAGYFIGNVYVDGHLSSSKLKLFKIDHPLDPENRYLLHYSVEAPAVRNLYEGVITLDKNGAATVDLPDYFAALNTGTYGYQLTPIGGPAPNLHIAREIEGTSFGIAGGAPGMKVSWQITALRNDPSIRDRRPQAEEDKTERERGTYLQPEAYGQPPERGLHFQATRAPAEPLAAMSGLRETPEPTESLHHAAPTQGTNVTPDEPSPTEPSTPKSAARRRRRPSAGRGSTEDEAGPG